ncbi:cupin domain-containing protein [Leucobacter sp. NPDC058333]|uniref:cupin domain-containing protein n=1 Tax=Leucobacter sp. NPDC058333 TaxID=3346450 RepID=UPI00365F4D9A
MSALLPHGHNFTIPVGDVDVELEAVDAAEVVAGGPSQGAAELGTIGGAEVGVWELRDGTVTDTEIDEIFVVISGGATIELLEVPGSPEETGRVIEVAAGDVMRLVAGTRTKWSVEDHIRKVYIAGE